MHDRAVGRSENQVGEGGGSNSNSRYLKGEGFAYVPAKIVGSDCPPVRPGPTALYGGSKKKIRTCQVHPYSSLNFSILYYNHRQ